LNQRKQISQWYIAINIGAHFLVGSKMLKD